jgi:hypothetical protein
LPQRNAIVAFTGLQDLSDFGVEALYGVYLAIAEADWKWRRTAVYGAADPPPGHAMFRPLSFDVFAQRMQATAAITHGEQTLRRRLSRQAAAYRVDVGQVASAQASAAKAYAA